MFRFLLFGRYRFDRKQWFTLRCCCWWKRRKIGLAHRGWWQRRWQCPDLFPSTTRGHGLAATIPVILITHATTVAAGIVWI